MTRRSIRVDGSLLPRNDSENQFLGFDGSLSANKTCSSRFNGVSRNAVGDSSTKYDNRKEDLVGFVKHGMKRKECIHFVPKIDKDNISNGQPITCHCGEVPERHIKGTSGISDFFERGVDAVTNDLTSGRMKSADWQADQHIRKFPTNAFGKIDFVDEGLGARKASKYVRIADDTPISLVLELMLSHWHLHKPFRANLAITVIGGAKNFNLDGKKKEVFNRGLVNAAQTTHAWIITSGFNMGVMKAVGEAVQEGQGYNWDRLGMTHVLRCIGIAPWGYVEKRNTLVDKEGSGCWNATYKSSNTIRHFHPVSLDPNHTHFLLVDDGIRGRYGGVAEFRARLERKISLPVTAQKGEDTGLGIPVVLVVVEGGTDAILDVSRSLQQKIPVVICDGTGRAADILAYTFKHFVTTRNGERRIKEKHKLIVEDKLLTAYGKTWQERSDEQKEVNKYMKIVLDCCTDEKLITVFDMNKNEELDIAILSALLKGQGATSQQQILDQLKLALTWNRSDVAEEKIFTKNVVWPSGSLDDVMTEALIDNKVDFVRLLLKNGVIMKEYLTATRLLKLYNSTPRLSHLRQLLAVQSNSSFVTLKAVHRLMKKLIGKHVNQFYQDDGDSAPKDAADIFDCPFSELFFWAVLMNRVDLAMFLWERGDEAITSAIVASHIYSSLAQQLPHQHSDLRDSYEENARMFEKLAVNVIDMCQMTEPEKAEMLLEKKHAVWGDMCCLEIAASAHCKEFLSTTSCQNLINQRWYRGMSAHPILLTLAMVCPPLIFCVLKFEQNETSFRKMSPWTKLSTFYQAPATKFACNMLLYLCFLVLYSYMLLFDFRPTIQLTEWIVLCWILTMLSEKTRQIFFAKSTDTIHDSVLYWWHFSAFKRLDLIIFAVSILGFIFRWIPSFFIRAKVVYCVSCVLFYIRLLRDYSASSYLGPKLVMIRRMTRELVIYILIMIVFLLAYGISIYALMHPVRDAYILIFRDIFYYPYWQIYGELFLVEIEGRTEDCLGNNTIMSDGVTPCPQYSWLVPVLTAGYLLITNVLLLNLLIAIFTHVFEEMEMNSIQIWKFGMYILLVEYDMKPILAPPLSIIEHAFLTIRFLLCRICCKNTITTSQLVPRQEEMLHVFEKEMMTIFIRRRRQLSRQSLEMSVAKILSRVDEMSILLAEDISLEQQHYKALQNRGGYHVTGDVSTPSRHSRTMSIDSIPSMDSLRFIRWPTMQQLQRLQSNKDVAGNSAHVLPGALSVCAEKSDSDNEAATTHMLDSRRQRTFDDPHDAEIAHGSSRKQLDGKEANERRKRRKKRDKTQSKPHDVSNRQDDESKNEVIFFQETSQNISKAVNDVHEVTGETVHSLHTRLSQFEEKTQQCLHNIEILLRNFDTSVIRSDSARPI